MKKIVVVDLEGTLSDDSNRAPLFFPNMTQEDYHNWNRLLHRDPPRLPIVALVTALSVSYEVYILTAKPIQYKKDVIAWLHKHTIFEYQDLLMRPDGCMKTSPELKKYFLQGLWHKGLQIIIGIDDRQDICDMYAENKITTLQVNYERR